MAAGNLGSNKEVQPVLPRRNTNCLDQQILFHFVIWHIWAMKLVIKSFRIKASSRSPVHLYCIEVRKANGCFSLLLSKLPGPFEHIGWAAMKKCKLCTILFSDHLMVARLYFSALLAVFGDENSVGCVIVDTRQNFSSASQIYPSEKAVFIC